MRKFYYIFLSLLLTISFASVFAQKRSVDKLAVLAETSDLTVNSYPNPFNVSTTIEFKLLSDKRLTLKIYDLTGRVITTLADKKYAAGTHTIQWDGSSSNGSTVNQGIYYYCLETADKRECRRIVKTN